MKLLFITAMGVEHTTTGGFQCTHRNHQAFCELLGPGNVDVLDTRKKTWRPFIDSFHKLIRSLLGLEDPMSLGLIKRIVKDSSKYQIIFINDSQYGIIARYLKKAKYKGKVITFFHNVEYNIIRQTIGSSPLSFRDGYLNLVNTLRVFVIFHNEKSACKYSDAVIALNKRDKNELYRLYGYRAVYIIPISFRDTLKSILKEKTSVPPACIFVGSYWYSNSHGILWFLDNILPHVNIKLQIAGYGMDALKEKFIGPKIEYLGFVPDLSLVILNADFMVIPIFKGGGMKVKTCEALMYGKNIIGTTEAFEGYEIDPNKVGVVCNTKEEFIKVINSHCSVKIERFNEYSREYFLKKYSFQVTLKQFEQLLANY